MVTSGTSLVSGFSNYIISSTLLYNVLQQLHKYNARWNVVRSGSSEIFCYSTLTISSTYKLTIPLPNGFFSCDVLSLHHSFGQFSISYVLLCINCVLLVERHGHCSIMSIFVSTLLYQFTHSVVILPKNWNPTTISLVLQESYSSIGTLNYRGVHPPLRWLKHP